MLKAINTFFSRETDNGILPEAEIFYLMTDTHNLEQHISQLFETLRQPVYQYLLAVFGNPAEAEDLTQDAFLQLYKTVKGGQTIRNVRFWIFASLII